MQLPPRRNDMVNKVLCLIIIAVPAFAWQIDQHPAASGEWGYHPVEDVVVDINPPAFSWRPDKNAVSYVMEIAEDADFSDVAYTSGEILWSSHCPNVSLPAGSYYWRYRGRNGQRDYSDWSQVRKFNVPEGLVHFPMPSREELQIRMPAEHPRLFFKQEDLTALQEMTSGVLAAQWQQLVDRADKLLQNPPDTTEPPLYPKGTERKGEAWKKIWWGNRVHAIKVTDAAATLAFVYRLSGEEKYGQAARKLIMEFCDWDPKGSTNYTYNDEAAMPLLYYPSRAYTWAYDVFTEEERERIRSVMKVRGEDCFNHLRGRRHLWKPFASHSNRAWHWLGEVATAFYDDIAEAPDWLSYSMTIFYTCYPVWGGADGGWHEGQAYWASYLRRFMYWVLVLDSIYDINAFEKPFFSKAGDFGLYTCPPGTNTGAFGDQAIKSNSRAIASFMGLMGVLAKNPHWNWYADKHGETKPGGYFGFLMAAKAQKAESKPPDTLPTSKVFRDVGVAALNTTLLDGANNVQVHFKSSPYGTQSHGYNPNNSFLLNINGERALIRSGKRDVHGSPHHQKWMWQTKSDNAILVDGKGQFPHTHQAKGTLTHFFTSENLDVVAGEAGESYHNLHRWSRRIIFFKPGVILIHDILDAKEAATFQWLLHAQAPFEVGEKAVSLESDTIGRIDISFLTPNDLSFSQKDTFDTPPHEWAFTLEEWHFVAETQQPAASMEFITLLRVDNAEVEIVQEDNDQATLMTLVMTGREAKIILRDDQFQIQDEAVSKVFFDSDFVTLE